MSATSILINVGAKTASAVSELNKVNGALNKQLTTSEKVKNGLKAANKVALASFTALAAGAAVAIKAASDQEQAYGALDKVYGKNAESAKKWAEEQTKIGLSASEAANAAVQIGTNFTKAGLSSEKALKKTQEILAAGADAVAVYGGSVADYSDSVAAAYRGEYDSLEKYNIKLKESKVQEEAARLSKGKMKGATEEAIRAQAVQNLILKDTADIQGAAADESDSYAATMAELKATLTNAAAVLGESLLPIISSVTEKFSEFAGWVKENSGLVTVIIGVLAGLAAVVVTVNAVMAVWGAIAAIAGAATTVLGVAFTILTSPITLIILAIAAVIAIGVLLYKNWDKISAWLKRTWESIKQAASNVWNSIKNFFINTWNSIKDWTVNAWNVIKDKAVSIWNSIKDFFARLWDGIKNLVSSALDGIKAAISWYFNLYKTIFTTAWNGLKTIVTTAWSKIKEGAVAGATALVDYIKGLPARILRGLGNIGSLLYNKGRDLIQGFINGIKSLVSKIPFIDKIPGLSAAVASTRSAGAARYYSAPTGGISALSAGAYSRSSQNVVIKVDGSGDPVRTAQVVKRALEGYDRNQGRVPGVRLTPAW